MRFKVYGPYNIGVEKRHARWIDEEDINSLCEEIYRRDGLHLSKACGVYLFGMMDEQGKRGKAGRTLPWYVGKAERQSFRGEGFSLPKLYHYNSILINKYRGRGTPILFLLARVEEDDTHSLPAKGKSYWGVQFVEEMFIKKSLRANPNLLNKSKTETSRKTSIRGLLNTTKYRSSSVDKLKLFEDFRYTSRIEILRDLHVEGFVKSKQGRKTGAVNALKSLLEQ